MSRYAPGYEFGLKSEAYRQAMKPHQQEAYDQILKGGQDRLKEAVETRNNSVGVRVAAIKKQLTREADNLRSAPRPRWAPAPMHLSGQELEVRARRMEERQFTQETRRIVRETRERAEKHIDNTLGIKPRTLGHDGPAR